MPLKVDVPAKVNRPLVMRSAIVLSIVVLPDPLAPIIAVRVPAGIDAKTECRICFVFEAGLPFWVRFRGR